MTNFGPHFVTGLLGPLLIDEHSPWSRGYYQRPLHGAPDGGGRVTELMAKPVIDLLFPALAVIEQPLAGETAAPRWVLEKCGLADGYAVELALLIDVASRFGVEHHRPGRPGGPGPPEPAAVRAPAPGHRHPAARPWPGPR